MGVMSCDRRACENIMCDTHISGIGYICSECKDEFKEYLEYNNITVLTEGEINQELLKFINMDKNFNTSGDKIDIDDFFNQHTR